MILFLAFSGHIRPLYAQSPAQALVENGYENVAVHTSAGHTCVTYENRIYRSEARALADVLQLVSKSAPPADTLSILVRHNDLPVVLLTTTNAGLGALLAGEQSYDEWLGEISITLKTDAAENRLTGIPKQNRSRYKIDIPVGLGMRYQLGNYNDPFQFAFDLEPELRMQIMQGVTASARIALPMYNNYDRNTYVRPVRFILSREFKPQESLYTSVSAGLFGRNRAGVHASMKKYLYEEALATGFEAGYTTFSGLSGKVTFPETEQQNYFFYTASLDFRWRRYDLNMQARYGNFLYQDHGFVLDIYRQFSEVTGGFFLIHTSLGSNAGFRFSIPLVPRRYPAAGVVRIRPARNFTLNYRYQGNDFSARDYDTGITVSTLLPEWYPSFLEKELKKYLD